MDLILSSNIKHVFLGDSYTFLVIISSKLDVSQEQLLVDMLREYKFSLGWTTADINSISPLICSHWINLEDEAIPRREPQRILNQ